MLPESLKGGVTDFYAEVSVQKTVPGSYFEVCGFAGGYFGIQDLAQDKAKVGIFSVWDAADGEKKKLAPNEMANIVLLGDGVRGRRFGGEGTGSHTDFDYDWRLDTTYRFYLHAQIEGPRTVYDAYIGNLAGTGWKHVATLSAANGGKKMTGLYSFIEDFRRDTASAAEVRRALFGHSWVRDGSGDWTAIESFRFTANKPKAQNQETIDAGISGSQIYMQTGGDTTTHTPVKSVLRLPDPHATPQAEPRAESK